MSELDDLKEELENANQYLETLRSKIQSDDTDIDEQIRYIDSLKNEIEYYKFLPPEPADSGAAEESSISQKPKLAIVIGHCSFKEGACGLSPLECENAFNTVVADKIKKICDSRGITCRIFTREWIIDGNKKCLISSTYTRRVKPWAPECTVELHYNAGNPNPPYTVTLFARNDSKEWSLELQDRIRKVYNRSDDQAKKVWKVTSGKNGYSSTKHLRNSALIEPFFGNIQSDADMGHEKIDDLAEAVVDSFVQFTGLPLTS